MNSATRRTGQEERSRLAPEGLSILVATVVLAVAGVVAALLLDRWAVWGVAGVLVGLAVSIAWFFRDPARPGPRGEDIVLSAADGLVLGSKRVEAAPYLDGAAVRVSVFLSLLDVHVNRFPVSGRVEWRQDRDGRFEPAWRESASRSNASVTIGLRRKDGRRVAVRQIVGLVARRIVNPAAEGYDAEQGARMGMIRFGSRVDLFLPPDAEVLVERGDRASGGVTVIARLGHTPGGRGEGGNGAGEGGP